MVHLRDQDFFPFLKWILSAGDTICSDATFAERCFTAIRACTPAFFEGITAIFTYHVFQDYSSQYCIYVLRAK